MTEAANRAILAALEQVDAEGRSVAVYDEPSLARVLIVGFNETSCQPGSEQRALAAARLIATIVARCDLDALRVERETSSPDLPHFPDENPSVHLRFVERDGRRILQQWWSVDGVAQWRDVRLADETTNLTIG